MSQLLPASFLFRYTFTVPRVEGIPRRGKRLVNLPPACTVPSLAELDGRRDFAELRVGWNERGLGLTLIVRGKRLPLACDPERPDQTDGLRLWIDTRHTQSVHRAGRFCHHFELLPTGGGRSGDQPIVVQRPVARAQEDARFTESESFPIQAEVARTGYWMDAWFPADTLQGYEPVSQPELGFYSMIHDAELGDQPLSVGAEFPFASDPSLWGTLQLAER
jgi:hypothetical protein